MYIYIFKTMLCQYCLFREENDSSKYSRFAHPENNLFSIQSSV